MKLMVFVKSKKTIDRKLELLLFDLRKRKLPFEILDINGEKSQSLAKIYDVIEMPALVLARDDGAPVASWRHSIPNADEVSYQYGFI